MFFRSRAEVEGKAFTFKVKLRGEMKQEAFVYLDSGVEIVERYEVTFLTDEDVVPHRATGGGQVGGEVPGLDGEAQPGEAVQDRLACVSRHSHWHRHSLERPGIFLVLLLSIDEVKVGRTVGKQGSSQPSVINYNISTLSQPRKKKTSDLCK